MKKIYCIRHGQSESNSSGIRTGAETNLTEKGFTQAEVVGNRLKNIDFEILLASPMQRAQDTGKAVSIITGKPLVSFEEARERTYPTDLIGLHRKSEEAKNIFKDMRTLWETKHERYSDEEDFKRLLKRVKFFTEKIEGRSEENIVIITHDFFMRVLLGYVLFGDDLTAKILFNMYDSVNLSNTGIIHYTISDEGQWKLEQWNDDAHLGELK